MLALLVPACAATKEQLLKRAAFDLDCPKTQLRVTTIDPRTKGVRGCGQKATYVQSCTGPNNVSNCTWVMNSQLGGARAENEDDE